MNQDNLENLNPNNDAINETFDEEEDRVRLDNDEGDQLSKLPSENKYKVKIIDTEITSLLHLQIMFYFNFYLNFVCFALELAASCYKLYVFKFRVLYAIRIVVICVWILVANFRLYNGYLGNINENVRKKCVILT